jgi:hypothetical protein
MVGNNLAVDVLTPHPKIKMEWLFDSERSDRHRQYITDESEPPRKAGQQYCPDNAVTKNRKKPVTADVAFGPWDLREWTEAMVTVK